MKTFIIHSDNNITAFVSPVAAEACRITDAYTITSESDLQEAASGWPAARLCELWNTLSGVTPVRRFTDRATAVRRIWNAIQNLEPAPEPPRPDVPSGEVPASPGTQRASKKTEVLALLHRPDGATLQEIRAVVPWQAHTVRGFLSGTVRKRMGLSLVSSRRADGHRAYRIERNLSVATSLATDNPRQA